MTAKHQVMGCAMLAMAYSLTLLSARTRAGLSLQKQVYAISPRQVNKHGVVP